LAGYLGVELPGVAEPASTPSDPVSRGLKDFDALPACDMLPTGLRFPWRTADRSPTAMTMIPRMMWRTSATFPAAQAACRQIAA
jgi:hypothetical protein